MDFTIETYEILLTALQQQGFSFQTFAQYIEAKENFAQPQPSQTVVESSNPERRNDDSGFKFSNKGFSNLVILRHDVDARPLNSLRFARIQAALAIAGTYYFRMVPQSWDEAIISEMVELGHEVGYHYETMDTCRGDVDKAYDEFCRHLEKFRKLTPVKTISMHGSPLSGFDNRDIWQKYDYKKLGIIAEPYFDIDFNQLYYITDTGRRWNGHLYNVRDKATKENPVTNPEFLKLSFHSTQDIIEAVKRGGVINKKQSLPAAACLPQEGEAQEGTKNNEQHFPQQAMLNFHPQRWNDKPLPWLKEYVWQNIKNQGKYVLLKLRK